MSKSLALKNGFDNKEYQLGYSIAQDHRTNINNTLKTLLTQVEAILGDTKQAGAFKDLIRWEMWALCDRNQHATYVLLGVASGYETTPRIKE